jgi:hypothetical protein
MRARAKPATPLTRGGKIRFLVGVLILALLAAAAAWTTTGGLAWETTASGLKYRVVGRGEGPNAAPTDIARVDYTGRLSDGTVFDSTEGRAPVEFPVGGVVPGFSEALQLMNKGSTYEVRIPPALGYGDNVPPGSPIPPGATLDFEITLVDRRALTAAEQQQMQQMEAMQRQQIEEMQRQMQQGGAPGAAGQAPASEAPGGEAPGGETAPPRGR